MVKKLCAWFALAIFILFPGCAQQNDDEGAVFGYYDNVPIEYFPVAQRFKEIEEYYRQNDVDISMMGYREWRWAFEYVVMNTAILQEVKSSNYKIPEKTSLEMVRDDLIKEMWFRDIDSLMISSGEAEFIGNMSRNARTFDMVSFSIDDYPDSEILAFAQKDTSNFGTIHLSRISIASSERDARTILNAITKGITTFEDAARIHSLDIFAEKGGDMGIFFVKDLESEIPNAEDRQNIVSLKKGEISDVIKIDTEWVFFRVENEFKAVDLKDKVVRDSVRDHIINFERGRMEDWAVSQAVEFIADVINYGFPETATARGLERHSFGPLPINFESVDLFQTLESFTIPFFPNMTSNEDFWKAAFSTEINTPSEPIIQGNFVLVLFPTEQTDADEEMIDFIALTYSSYWLRNETYQSIGSYFLNSPKLEDRFHEMYTRYLLPGEYYE